MAQRCWEIEGLEGSNKLSVAYLYLRPSGVVSGRKIHHLLDFITGPARVFAKNDALSLGGGRESHEGVAGGWPHPRVWSSREVQIERGSGRTKGVGGKSPV